MCSGVNNPILLVIAPFVAFVLTILTIDTAYSFSKLASVTIFVGDLDDDLTDSELRQAFDPFGEIL